jgi:pimeloyl-ACP methyl ester carboxylesterase
VDVPVSAVFGAPTVAGLEDFLTAQGAPPDFPDPYAPVLPLRERGSGAPLWILPAAHGLCWPFGALAAHIPDRPVLGLQARAYSARRPAASGPAGNLVADYVTRILAVQKQGPYHLLGHSLGGLIAHAVAVKLQRRGARVGLLAVLDGVAPAGAPEAGRRSAPMAETAYQLSHFLGGARGLHDHVPSPFDIADQMTRIFDKQLPGPRLVHHGNVHVFRTRRDGAEPAAEHWQGHVLGEIIEHTVPVGPADAGTVKAAAVIGARLSRELGLRTVRGEDRPLADVLAADADLPRLLAPPPFCRRDTVSPR